MPYLRDLKLGCSSLRLQMIPAAQEDSLRCVGRVDVGSELLLTDWRHKAAEKIKPPGL